MLYKLSNLNNLLFQIEIFETKQDAIEGMSNYSIQSKKLQLSKTRHVIASNIKQFHNIRLNQDSIVLHIIGEDVVGWVAMTIMNFNYLFVKIPELYRVRYLIRESSMAREVNMVE